MNLRHLLQSWLSLLRAPAAFRTSAIFLLALSASQFEGTAAPVSLEQAKTAVSNWIARESTPLNADIGTHVRSAKTIKDAKGRSLYHVLYLTKTGTSTSGIVFASCDDAYDPIVAFCSGENFDESPNSPLAAILACRMARRLDAAIAPASPPSAKITAAALKAKGKWHSLMTGLSVSSITPPDYIAPPSDVRVNALVQTAWSQASIISGTAVSGKSVVDCYNYYTPGPTGWVAGGSNNYVCGCVATALAQVMRYDKCPSSAYLSTVMEYIYPVYVDSAKVVSGSTVVTTSTDWVSFRGGNGNGGAYTWTTAVMPNNPQSSYATVVQCEAIGDLTYDAGVSVAMDYNSGGTGQSGADLFNFYVGCNPLTFFFQYTNAILAINYDQSIALQSLLSMINPNLDAGYPVILSIYDSDGNGHCVVCDGYGYNAETLYHHLNMGWAGQSDVWYSLPAIDTPGDYFSQVNECDYNIFTSGAGEIISGRVTDSGGGPLAGVIVSCLLNGATICTATTGSNGIYALAKVPSSSTFTVTATNSKFTFASQTAVTGSSTDWVQWVDQTGGSTWNDTTGNQWGLNFTPSASGTGAPTFLSSTNAIELANGGNASLGNTLCTIQIPIFSNITVSLAAMGSAVTYSATNLPLGLAISSSTGQITGAPTLAGSYSAIVTGSNAAGQGSGVLTFLIPYPFITSSSIITGTEGFALIYNIAVSNSCAGFSASGLPTGLTFSASTGLIAGAPSESGTFPATIGANAVIPAMFTFADGLTLDGSGNLYITDCNADTVRELSNGYLKTIAGAPITLGTADGPALSVSFNGPDGIGMDKAGNLYVADFYNDSIRKISATGTVTTFAGLSGTSGSVNGTGTSARFYYPDKLAMDGSGNIYIADCGNNMVRKVTSAGIVTTIAGSASGTGSTNGTGTAARFNGPQSVARDGSGNIYVSDQLNSTIRKITAAGVVSTLAGTPLSFGSVDGKGSAARFYYPAGLAVDGTGNVYVVDSGNYTIRKITPAGVVTTLAGKAGVSGTVDGTGTAANFYGSDGMTIDGSGNLYVSDSYTIRKVSTSTGAVTTLIGIPGVGGTYDSIVPCTSALTVAIVPPTAYQSWQLTYFGSNPVNSSAGYTVSNNKAGISNLLCYAMNLSPFAATVGELPMSGTTMVSSSNYLTLSFSRNGQATDITYTVQASNDISTWTSLCTFNGGAWSPSSIVTETGTSPNINVIVRDVQPLNSSPRRFMRLQITH